MKRFIMTVIITALIMALSVSAAANLALDAAAEGSSSYAAEYDAAFVNDGKIITPDAHNPFWVTDFESEANATITWAAEQSISRVVLYDLPSETENVISGSLAFSDGTNVSFAELDKTGAATEVAKFDTPVKVTSVKITVKADDNTLSVGLAEAEFYDANGINIARAAASATASSVGVDGAADVWNPAYFTDGWYAAANLYDGYFDIMSYENCEWSSAGDPYPSITLKWNNNIKIGTIVLYDRYDSADNAITGTIKFGDGNVIDFTGLDPEGRALYVDVPDVDASSFTITVTESAASNIGFGEIEVYTEHYANGAFIEDAALVTADPTPAESGAAPADAATVTAPPTFDGIYIIILLMTFCAAAVMLIKKSNKIR